MAGGAAAEAGRAGVGVGDAAGEPDPRAWWDAPVLTGALVRLEPLSLAHAGGLLAAADEDAVFAHLRDERPRSRADVVPMIEGILEQRASGRRVPWVQVALDRSGEVIVGTTSYL